MPPWCIGIHGSNPYKLNTLAMPFYSVIPLTRIPSALLVAKLLKMEQETVLEPDEAFNFSGVGCGAFRIASIHGLWTRFQEKSTNLRRAPCKVRRGWW